MSVPAGDTGFDVRPVALCCCGTPLVSTFEVRAKEWYCVTCERFYEWLHARRGTGPNPTPELEARHEAARGQYDTERATRSAAVRCSSVLLFGDVDDTKPVPAAIARCVLAAGHGKRHEGKDTTGSWFRW